MTLADRRVPLLGNVELIHYSHIPNEITARFAPSPLGNEIMEIWRDLPPAYQGIKTLYMQLMEEHLHCILHITQRIQKPLGNIIASFKAKCTQAYRRLFGQTSPLFSEGFQDTILFTQGQLPRMFAYIKDNPRRFAIKRLFPDLFKVLRNIPFYGGYLSGIGNPFLIDKPHFYQVQASRSIGLSTPQFQEHCQQMSNAIAHGAVVVSPCISPGERKLARLAFEQKAELIVLKNNNFPPLFKPCGEYFNACAEGRLLMLSPTGFGYQPGHRQLRRDEACVLNRIAQLICGPEAAQINYKGLVPTNLDELVAQALQKTRS